jgi:hypothetical protein
MSSNKKMQQITKNLDNLDLSELIEFGEILNELIETKQNAQHMNDILKTNDVFNTTNFQHQTEDLDANDVYDIEYITHSISMNLNDEIKLDASTQTDQEHCDPKSYLFEVTIKNKKIPITINYCKIENKSLDINVSDNALTILKTLGIKQDKTNKYRLGSLLNNFVCKLYDLTDDDSHEFVIIDDDTKTVNIKFVNKNP